MEVEIFYPVDEKQHFLFIIRVPDHTEKMKEILSKIQDIQKVSSNLKIFDVKCEHGAYKRVEVVVPTDDDLLVSIITDLKRAEDALWGRK